MRLSDLVDLYGHLDPVVAIIDPNTGVPVDPDIEEGTVHLIKHGPYPYIALELPADCGPQSPLICGCGSAPAGAPGASGCSPSCMEPEPWPLAEGDKVLLTVDAEVFARPDPEDEPGEDWWTFAVTVAGERVLLDGLLSGEVAERVRKAPTKSTGMRACA